MKTATVRLTTHGSILGACSGSGQTVRTRVKEVPHLRIAGKTETRAWCKGCRGWTTLWPEVRS